MKCGVDADAQNISVCFQAFQTANNFMFLVINSSTYVHPQQYRIGCVRYLYMYNMWYGFVLYIWIGLMFHISAIFICFTLYCLALLVAVENE